VLSARPFGLSVTDLLGVASVVIAFWFAVPQLVRLRRTGSAAGLSVESLANSTVSLVAWTGYGVAHASGWVVASSLVGLPAIVATLGIAVRGGLRLRPLLPAVWTGLLLLTAGADLLAGTTALDVVLGCSILWFVAPAAVTAWRSSDVSGIAWQTWGLLALEGLVFGVYGLVADVGADRVYGIAALVGTGAIASRLALGTRVTAPASPPVPVRRDPIVRLLDDTLPLRPLRELPDDTRPLPVLSLA
jgi:uncharacterized protein with PQ loop repeat